MRNRGRGPSGLQLLPRRRHAQLAGLAREALEHLANAPGGITGISTGIFELDAKTGGLHSGQYVAVGGRPSDGKTALGRQIAYHAATRGRKV